MAMPVHAGKQQKLGVRMHVAHPVRHCQVLHGGALCQKLRVAQDLKGHVGVRAIPPQHLPHDTQLVMTNPVRHLHACTWQIMVDCRKHVESAANHRGTVEPRMGCRTFSIASAVFTGTVDFSTTIFEVVETDAMSRAAPSQYVRSAALPAPTPLVFVGVFTLHGTGMIQQPHDWHMHAACS